MSILRVLLIGSLLVMPSAFASDCSELRIHVPMLRSLSEVCVISKRLNRPMPASNKKILLFSTNLQRDIISDLNCGDLAHLQYEALDLVDQHLECIKSI